MRELSCEDMKEKQHTLKQLKILEGKYFRSKPNQITINRKQSLESRVDDDLSFMKQTEPLPPPQLPQLQKTNNTVD